MTEMRDSTEGRVAERGAGNEVTREMRDVDHESPDGEGADRVFERGTEGRDESV